MYIEIRWQYVGLLTDNDNRFRTGEYVSHVLKSEQFLGLNIRDLSIPNKYEAIYVDSATWLEVQTKFEFYLLPRVKKQVSEYAEIYIEGHTLGAWLAQQEQKFRVLRQHIQKAVGELKKTRRFFRNKQVEAVRRDLEGHTPDFRSTAASTAYEVGDLPRSKESLVLRLVRGFFVF